MGARRKSLRAYAHASEWSTPPDGVLEAVVGALRPSDTAVLRLVCHGWRSAHGRVVTRLAPTTDSLALIECKQLFPNLRSLDLRATTFDPLRLFAGLSHDAPSRLTELNLGGCKHLSGDDLWRVTDVMPSLTTLSLARCFQLQATDLVHLTRLLNLRSLDLSHCDGVGAEGVAQLGRLGQLNTLCLADCDSIGDDAISRLTGSDASKALRYLDLNGCTSLTDRGIAEGVAACTSLRTLRLKCCESVTDQGVASLAFRCRSLRCLDLGWCGVTDASLDILACKLPELESLNLSWCDRITDGGLASLANASQLVELKLKGCVQITDTGLATLSTLSSLQLLNLRLCVQVSLPALKALEVSLRKHSLVKFTCSAAPAPETAVRIFADPVLDVPSQARTPQEPSQVMTGSPLSHRPLIPPVFC